MVRIYYLGVWYYSKKPGLWREVEITREVAIAQVFHHIEGPMEYLRQKTSQDIEEEEEQQEEEQEQEEQEQQQGYKNLSVLQEGGMILGSAIIWGSIQYIEWEDICGATGLYH